MQWMLQMIKTCTLSHPRKYISGKKERKVTRIFFLERKRATKNSGMSSPKLLVYIDFIYFTTMQILQLNKSNLLLTPFYVHKIQFISNKLRPQHQSSSHGQLRELVVLFSHRGSHFLKRHSRLFAGPSGQSELSSSIFQSNDYPIFHKTFSDSCGFALIQ